MRVKLLYFASVREAVGVSEEIVTIAQEIETVADLAAWLARTYPVFANTQRLRVAIDERMATMRSPVARAQEIAFFPPVTGG